MPLAKLVGDGVGGRVHTFEVHPKTRAVMMFNLLINDVFDTVSVHPYGLGDKRDNGKSILLSIGSTSKNSGSFSVSEEKHLNKGEERALDASVLRAKLVSFDEELGKGNCPTVIKTDLEGMDLKALRGAKKMIKKCRPGKQQ